MVGRGCRQYHAAVTLGLKLRDGAGVGHGCRSLNVRHLISGHTPDMPKWTRMTRSGRLRQMGTSRMPTLSAKNWQARRFRGGGGFNGKGVGRPPVQSRRAPLKGGDGIRGDDSDHVGGGAADSASVVQILSTCAKHKLPRPAKLALACCTMRTVIEYYAYSVDWK
jgi:hypothetical protein